MLLVPPPPLQTVRELVQLPGFEVCGDDGTWLEVSEAEAVQRLAMVLAGGGPQKYSVGQHQYEARRERAASGTVSFTQVNVKTKTCRALRMTPSLFGFRSDAGEWEPVCDATAAFIYATATGEQQSFALFKDTCVTEVEPDGALFQRNTRTQTRRRVRQIAPEGAVAASQTLQFSFQMDNGSWQQLSEAVVCAAMAKVHRDGGKQSFSSSANKFGAVFEYEVRAPRSAPAGSDVSRPAP